ncbi:hypothetical protein [Streptomyces canus]|uniref:hypothetical protein n=1 Tax=Streptomyces canus TaxID=58343 RepID=UPI000378CFE1|nr:hypothetical protein [Streptomyces canus]
MGRLSWLFGGNDHQLAAERYAGRESASDEAARKRRERHQTKAAKAARQGQRWEDSDRQRGNGKPTGWFRST